MGQELNPRRRLTFPLSVRCRKAATYGLSAHLRGSLADYEKALELSPGLAIAKAKLLELGSKLL